MSPTNPSASTIAVTATTATHILKISGYSHGKLFLSAGNWIQSAKVEAAGQSWRIRLYPNGEREESAGYISLFLELASECKEGIHTRFGISLVSHGGKLRAEKHVSGRLVGGPVTFASNNNTNRCFGFPMAIRREDLEKPEYLKDDTILIRCDIAVLNKPVVVAPQDLESLQLLCHCKDDLCKNLHAIDKEASKWISRVLKNLCLGCLPI